MQPTLLDSRGALDPLAGASGRTVYLAGAGGAGMRGLATFFLECGWRVWGADRHLFSAADRLVQAGLQPLAEADAPPPVSLAVRSVAVPADAPALRRARAGGARALTLAEALGEISRLRPVVAVAGSHGKTTTSAWIAYGLHRAGRRAGYFIGGHVEQLGASAAWGDPDLPLIVESCEYARSFHALRPQQVALTNVDAEHPDTYPGGLPEVRDAFSRFLALLPARGGHVFAGPEAPDLRVATQAQWIDAPPLPDGWQVGLPGRHNRRNAALVAEVLRSFGVEEREVRRAVAEFAGVARRMETVGSFRGVPVVSDYAHHPVEVAATLQAARERHPDDRLVVVFQPHQALRFTAYRDQFGPSLDLADAVVLLPVFRARDPADLAARSSDLLPDLSSRRPRPAAAVRSLPEGKALLASWLRPGDRLLCLGAGDVDGFARGLVG